MPFITEELWQALEPRKEGESLMVALIPEVAPVDNLYLEDFEIAKEIVGGVRTIRLQKNIPNKEALELQVLGEHNDHFNSVIAKMCNLSSIIRTEEKAAGSASFLVRTTEYAVPLGNMINVEEELAKLQDELKYQQCALLGGAVMPGYILLPGFCHEKVKQRKFCKQGSGQSH